MLAYVRFLATDVDKGPIFGVPLAESLKYASVVISVTDEAGDTYVYGVVPIVVAKCGLFLKEEGMSRIRRRIVVAPAFPSLLSYAEVVLYNKVVNGCLDGRVRFEARGRVRST